MGDTLGLTRCRLPTMEADRPTIEGKRSEATGCTPTWKTGPRSAVASSPTASAGDAACREYKIHWKTLKKILDNPEPPGYRRTKARRPSILEPLLPVVHQILEDDKKAPRKQRHTARRIFDRLRAEHGYQGGLTMVKVAVRAWRLRSAEVFVPLAHPPGEAQADFGQAEVTLDGQPAKVAVFVMTLPYSDAIFACTFPRECTEAFLEGHVRAFAFFGGVPRRISYDNSKIAVARITGPRDRKLTDEFLRLKSHHLFQEHFCLVRRPNEKGHVETLVGFARRNFLVPVPVAHGGLEGLNAGSRPTAAPTSRGGSGASRRPRPSCSPRNACGDAALAGRGVPGRSGRATHRRLALAGPLRHQRLLGADGVRPSQAHRRRDGGHAPDRRRKDRGGRAPAVLGSRAVFYDPVHYLALLERKPGALDFAAPLAGWELPVCFGVLRRRLEAESRRAGDAAVHQGPAAAGAGEPEGADPRRRAGVGAGRGRRRRGAADPGAPRRGPVGLFCLDGRPHLGRVAVPAPDLSAYASLAAGVTS